MTDPDDRSESTWLQLRRFFQLEGKLGGIRYSARVRVLELTDPDAEAPPQLPPSEGKQLPDSTARISADDSAP